MTSTSIIDPSQSSRREGAVDDNDGSFVVQDDICGLLANFDESLGISDFQDALTPVPTSPALSVISLPESGFGEAGTFGDLDVLL